MVQVISLISSSDEDDNDQHSSYTTLSETKIEIKVRRSDGSQDLVIRVPPAETIGNIKEMIFSLKNIEVNRQRILFAGKEIRNNSTLKDYNVLDGFVITLLVMPDTGDEQRNVRKRKRTAANTATSKRRQRSNESKAKSSKNGLDDTISQRSEKQSITKNSGMKITEGQTPELDANTRTTRQINSTNSTIQINKMSPTNSSEKNIVARGQPALIVPNENQKEDTLNDQSVSMMMKDAEAIAYKTIAPQYHEMILSLLDTNGKDLEKVIDQLGRLTRKSPPVLPDAALMKKMFEWGSGINGKHPPRMSSMWILLNDVACKFPTYVITIGLNKTEILEKLLQNLINHLRKYSPREMKIEDMSRSNSNCLGGSENANSTLEKSKDKIKDYCRKIIPAFEFMKTLIEKDALSHTHGCDFQKIGQAFRTFWDELNGIFLYDDNNGMLLADLIINCSFQCLFGVYQVMCTLAEACSKQERKIFLSPFVTLLKDVYSQSESHAITKLINKISSVEIRKYLSENRNFVKTGINLLPSKSRIESVLASPRDCDISLSDQKAPRLSVSLHKESTGECTPIQGRMDTDFPPMPTYDNIFFNATVACKRTEVAEKGIGPFNHNPNKSSKRSQLVIQVRNEDGLLPWRDKSGRLKFLSPNIRYAMRRKYHEDNEEVRLKYSQIYRKILRKFWGKMVLENGESKRGIAQSSHTSNPAAADFRDQKLPCKLLVSILSDAVTCFHQLGKKTLVSSLGMTNVTKAKVLACFKGLGKDTVCYEEFVWTIESHCGFEVGDTILQYIENGGQITDYDGIQDIMRLS